MAAGELADGDGGTGFDDRRNDRRKAASIRELRMENRVVLVELFAQLVGNHLEAGAESGTLEADRCFAAQDPVAPGPPGCVGITHDLADALVQQERLDGAKEGKDQLEAHRGYLLGWKPSQSRAS